MAKMSTQPVIALLRRDLRLQDNPALHAARELQRPIIPLFVWDEKEEFAVGAAARWWLHLSLEKFSVALKHAGLTLTLRKGPMAEIVEAVAIESDAFAVYWNRRYSKGQIEADKAIKSILKKAGVDAKSFNGSLLREPWEIVSKSGGPYRVYTPFWKALRATGPNFNEALVFKSTVYGASTRLFSDDLNSWNLKPSSPDWAEEFSDNWTPGEDGARHALVEFLDGPAACYDGDRNLPGIAGTSRLSPHLAFGEISPAAIWRETILKRETGELAESEGEKFLSELAWRDFSYNLLYYHPALKTEPLRPEFKNFPWRKNTAGFASWKRGLTGYPIVDAGMRELWRTGWMHNRVRMIVASFLIKDLLVDWRNGEAWFWDTLVDADPANNTASWQWVAGCGADASPYFRIFNPVTQSRKFDPEGSYIRRFVPELSSLPNVFVHEPWAAPKDVLREAGVVIGDTYPAPIVDHAIARKRALEAYQSIKNG